MLLQCGLLYALTATMSTYKKASFCFVICTLFFVPIVITQLPRATPAVILHCYTTTNITQENDYTHSLTLNQKQTFFVDTHT